MRTLIPDSRFLYYADHFALAANAGHRSAQALFTSITAAASVNPLTFEIFEDAITIKNQLIDNLQTAYETVYTAASALDPMRQAFNELSLHIEQFAGQDVDDYLTERGLQVFPTYANISAQLGRPISTGNLKSTTQ